jgi:hypothetical protein
MHYLLLKDEVPCYTAKSCPFGFTYGHWTVEWWRWFLSIPKSIHPAFDATGESGALNQPQDHVWFLVGKVGNESRDIPERFCRIPRARSILIPVINCEVNPIECPQLKSHQNLIDRVLEDENTVFRTECIVDGKLVLVERVRSDPMVFDVRLDNNNAFDIRGGGSTVASADGYWVFLKPLSDGEHSIEFRGSCENGRLHTGAKYQLQIE